MPAIGVSARRTRAPATHTPLLAPRPLPRSTTNGGLNEEAGRLEVLDEIVRKFVAAAESEREEIIEAAGSKVAELGDEASSTGAYYVKAMRKYAAKGSEWVTTETARLARMAKSDAIAVARKTSILLRRNVLGAFVSPALDTEANDEL